MLVLCSDRWGEGWIGSRSSSTAFNTTTTTTTTTTTILLLDALQWHGRRGMEAPLWGRGCRSSADHSSKGFVTGFHYSIIWGNLDAENLFTKKEGLTPILLGLGVVCVSCGTPSHDTWSYSPFPENQDSLSPCLLWLHQYSMPDARRLGLRRTSAGGSSLRTH